MTQYGFYFNGQRCTGCKACVAACKDYHDHGTDISFRQVYEYGGGNWTQGADGLWTNTLFGYYVSVACNHCDDPACVAACPVASMQKDPESGLVFNDPTTCIGCGSCATACPYGAPAVDAAAKISVKCNGCYERTSQGGTPVCVAACPLRALEFGPIDELRAAYGEEAAIAPLPAPDETHPNLVINPADCAKPSGSAEGELLNDEELVR